MTIASARLTCHEGCEPFVPIGHVHVILTDHITPTVTFPCNGCGSFNTRPASPAQVRLLRVAGARFELHGVAEAVEPQRKANLPLAGAPARRLTQQIRSLPETAPELGFDAWADQALNLPEAGTFLAEPARPFGDATGDLRARLRKLMRGQS